MLSKANNFYKDNSISILRTILSLVLKNTSKPVAGKITTNNAKNALYSNAFKDAVMTLSFEKFLAQQPPSKILLFFLPKIKLCQNKSN